MKYVIPYIEAGIHLIRIHARPQPRLGFPFIEMRSQMKRQDKFSTLMFAGVALSVLGIILISPLGRSSYVIIGAGVVLMVVGWISRRRMQ